MVRETAKERNDIDFEEFYKVFTDSYGRGFHTVLNGSAHADNIAMSERFRTALVEFCKEHGLNTDAWWNSGTGIRKLGHIIEYGILGFCSSIAFLDFSILSRKDNGGDTGGASALLKSLATVLIF